MGASSSSCIQDPTEELAPMGRSYDGFYRASQPPSTGRTAPCT